MRGALALFLLAPIPAGAFDLALPLDCTLNESCFVQHLFDHDSGPGTRDFACGALTYDGHDGTDIALPSLAAMAQGVTVRAAAPGVVRGARDGMPDIVVSDPAAPPLDGRDCGNGVAIRHDDGWETQYCHMKRGSIVVKPGDRVAAGTPLGQVGLSGNTEFPHLHLTLRRDGQEVDPWAPEAGEGCGPAGADLWQGDLTVPPGGIITTGLATAIPEYAAVKQGAVPPPAGDPSALVVWSYLYGTRAGDRLHLALRGPDGAVIADEIVLEKPQAQSFRAIGKKRGVRGWPAGSYEGAATLSRDGTVIDSAAIRLTLP